MKFFVDTAEVSEIIELNDLGMVDGVTTNPSLIKKSGRDILEVTKEICGIVSGPVSAEVTATDADKMIAEGRKLAELASNIAVKLPLTWDGLKACRVLSQEGKMVNVTLCFAANQALLAAKAGATFISPFIGRLDDINLDGMELIEDIREIYDNYDALETEILAASIRSDNHVKYAAQADADLAEGKSVGPLHGVPMTIKDSLDTFDFITTWGTQGRAAFRPSRDASVVARLRGAGAILVGKTNTPEFTIGNTKLITNQLGYVQRNELRLFETNKVFKIKLVKDNKTILLEGINEMDEHFAATFRLKKRF